MQTKGSRRFVARLLLGALFFAQAALAVATCDSLRMTPAQALAAQAAKPTCHEVPAENTNLCLAHCLSADQNSDTPQIHVHAWTPAPLVILAASPTVATPEVIRRGALPHAGAPPPRILFQSFLI